MKDRVNICSLPTQHGGCGPHVAWLDLRTKLVLSHSSFFVDGSLVRVTRQETPSMKKSSVIRLFRRKAPCAWIKGLAVYSHISS